MAANLREPQPATVFRLSHGDEGVLSAIDEATICGEFEFVHDEYAEILRFGEFDHVLKTIQAINDRIVQRRNVLVHCVHGRDRTGLIVGAYLIKYASWTVKQVQEMNALYGEHGLIAFIDFPDKLILDEIAAQQKG